MQEDIQTTRAKKKDSDKNNPKGNGIILESVFRRKTSTENSRRTNAIIIPETNVSIVIMHPTESEAEVNSS